MSIYEGILNSENNDIKAKFLKQLVTERGSVSNQDEINKRLKFLYRACIGEYSCTTIFFSAIFVISLTLNILHMIQLLSIIIYYYYHQ